MDSKSIGVEGKVFKRIEDIVRYEVMSKYARMLDVRINQLFGGYLRQPIMMYHNQEEDRYVVVGKCALTGFGKDCVREVPSQESSVCYECNVYKNLIDRTRTG